jgi:hypothetical protein
MTQGGIISGIQVESSTDKQGLSIRLQNELKGIGYSGDNTGLSKARCGQITDYLVGLGIDSSLVTSNQVVEAGTGTVDASARYVIVKIVYLDEEVVATPGIVEKIPQLKEIHYLSKEVEITKHKKTQHKKHHVRHKKTKVKKCKNITKCLPKSYKNTIEVLRPYNISTDNGANTQHEAQKQQTSLLLSLLPPSEELEIRALLPSLLAFSKLIVDIGSLFLGGAKRVNEGNDEFAESKTHKNRTKKNEVIFHHVHYNTISQ